ncbi:hypothetical protein UlMin_006173, partial [Ulmus minor]
MGQEEVVVSIRDQDLERKDLISFSSREITSVYEKLANMVEERKKKKRFQTLTSVRKIETTKPKIQRVPDFLRGQKRFEKYYEPRWISIGPIHHCKASKLIQLAEDQYKLDLAASFISNSGRETEFVYSKIKEEINELKNCFQEDLIEGFADETLSWMLFLDGCSILEFIYSFVFDKLKNFKIKKEQVIFAQQDLFLLENQIPFRVLKLLMDSSKEKEALKSSIKEFIRVNVMAPYKLKRNVEIKMEPEPTVRPQVRFTYARRK